MTDEVIAIIDRTINFINSIKVMTTIYIDTIKNK